VNKHFNALSLTLLMMTISIKCAWAQCDNELNSKLTAKAAHVGGQVEWENVQRKDHASYMKNYSQSLKLSAADRDSAIEREKKNISREENYFREHQLQLRNTKSRPIAIGILSNQADFTYNICLARARIQQLQNSSPHDTRGPELRSNQPQQPSQSNQSTQQQSQQSSAEQNQAQAAQQQAQQNQTRADQTRQGQRRRHEPENEASHCIQPDFGGLYGGMKNTCDFKVWFTYCGYRPKESSWLTGMNCEKQSFGSDSVSPGRTNASHTKGVEMLYWFACKEPAWTVDSEFVLGQGIRSRCYTVGGK
jgi:hypothetical protein